LNEVGRKKSIAEKCGGNQSDVAAVARGAGELWGALSDADKKPYQALAEKDKARYAKEMESYVPSEDPEPKKKKGKKGKKEKDPNKPKRPMTAFLLWMGENRATISKDPAVQKVTDVLKIGGQKWQLVDAATKAKFDKLAAEAKAKYEKDMAAYKPTKGGDDADDEEDEE
jgi:hypothetical protein